MTEIDPARKRGDGGEDVATGLRNKQIIGCQSGVARCLLVVCVALGYFCATVITYHLYCKQEKHLWMAEKT